MTPELEDRTVALIGGAGFIGHHLALELDERGADVEVVDSLQVNNLLAVSTDMPEGPRRDLYLGILHDRLDRLHDAGIPVHPQDARDYHATSNILSSIDPDVLIHLAAVAHAGRANKNPYSTFDHSLRTLENTLDYAREMVDHFIYFSSSMVYGDFQEDGISETHPLNPKGIYGALKVAGEEIVKAYHRTFDLDYTTVRPSALYGPRCISRRVGQIFIENALAGDTLQVDGDGSDRLDFTYVDDLVDGICRCIDHEEALNEAFNMTYGEARSILDLVDVLKKHFPDIEVEHVPRDEMKPRRGTMSIAKARKTIGYDPNHPIEVGFDKYIRWYRSFLDEHNAEA